MRVLRIAGTVALWIVNVLAAAAFVAIGLGKFGSPEWVTKFERWGYPDGFYRVIGVLEIAAGVLLLVPKLSSYAAVLLGVILIAAAATLRLNHLPMSAPLAWLGVIIVLGLVRCRRAWRPGIRTVPVVPARRSFSEGGNQV